MSLSTSTRQAWLFGQPQQRCDTAGRHECWCTNRPALIGGKWCSIWCRDREELEIKAELGLDSQAFAGDLPEPLDRTVEKIRSTMPAHAPSWFKPWRN